MLYSHPERLPRTKGTAVSLAIRILSSIILSLTILIPAHAAEYTAMTAPLPPYAINKGLHVHGIAVDALAVIMTLSGSPMETDDVKLMLWTHGLKLTAAGPQKVLLNVPRTPKLDPLFKWVGPIDVLNYVVIGREDCKPILSVEDLNESKVATIRDSLPEKALLALGVNKEALASSITHVIPLKKLQNRMIEYFAHGDLSTIYLMERMGMNAKNYHIKHTYLEVPLYYAFSKDTSDDFIEKLNENLVKLKKPGSDGKSRFDKIVAKYLPNRVMGQ